MTEKNIQSREEIEESLREQKESLRVILNSIGDAVIATDVYGKVLQMNPTAEKLTGWKFEDACQKEFDDIFQVIRKGTHEKMPSPFLRAIKRDNTQLINEPLILIARDGSEYCIDDSATPITDKNGNVTGMVIIFKDITEKLKANEEQIKFQKLEAIGMLTAGIAHDFNNMFTAIFGNLELAMMELKEDSSIYQILKDAYGAVDKATNITSQLLAFAKGGKPVMETLNLKNILHETVKFNMAGSNIKASYKIADDLWNIKADKAQINQVISALVTNAIQSMPSGGNLIVEAKNIAFTDELQVCQGCDASQAHVKLIIIDEGIGISDKDQHKLFSPYFTTKKDHSGIGLSIVHGIVTKHNGCILVSSEVNVGTTVSVHLPAGNALVDEHVVKADNAVIRKSFSGRVLVMDDEAMIRKVAGKMLNNLGLEAEFAEDGDEAIEKYLDAKKSKQAFDLVIMDLTIPGKMGGEETIQKLLALDPDAKVVISSGYVIEPVVLRFKEYGFKDRLNKPYKKQDLMKVLSLLMPDDPA